jgi:hypothetical protein
MATAPYGVRLLVGAAVTAIEETRKLPQTILMYPITLVSQAAHIVMRLQQNVAELVIKGDNALESLFPPKDEQPEWATFDEDLTDELPEPDERRTEGRFALYSVSDIDPPTTEIPDTALTPKRTTPRTTARRTVAAPAIVDELDYEALTLAQLRARLQSLDVGELEELLAYEEATTARAPFQTLLANRITRATAK